MQRTELLAVFDSYKDAAHAIGVTLGAVSNWKKTGMVPELRAREFEEVTGGKLKFRPEAYRKGKARPSFSKPRGRSASSVKRA